MFGTTSILREAWVIAARTADKRQKVQALSLAKECYSMKLGIINYVIDNAIRFVKKVRASFSTISSAIGAGIQLLELSDDPMDSPPRHWGR